MAQRNTRRLWLAGAVALSSVGMVGGLRVARAPFVSMRSTAPGRPHLAPLASPARRAARAPPRAAARGVLANSSVQAAVLPALIVVVACIMGMMPASAAFIPGRRSVDQLLKRTFTGCALGLVVSCWIFSSLPLYVAAFCAMGVLAQQEYFMMATSRGFFPARRLSMVTSVLMYVSGADGRRFVVDAALPLAGIYTTVYLLTRPTPPPTLDDLTSTFMGIYYLGFLPSFWVRLKGLQAAGAPFEFAWWPTRLLGDGLFTHGAVITWWTFLAIVCSDIGAYFVGKRFGSTKLISSVSPNKTQEGALGGMGLAMLVSMLGAYLMGWPRWYLSGAIHGVLASVMALVGDLTISMFKRSSGVKVRRARACLRAARGERSGGRARAERLTLPSHDARSAILLGAWRAGHGHAAPRPRRPARPRRQLPPRGGSDLLLRQIPPAALLNDERQTPPGSCSCRAIKR
jgi:phosphatidate cytidylyltransferase